MYSTNQQLHPTTMLTGQEMFGDSGMMYGVPQKKEIFYTIKDGSWTDVTVWETVSGKVGSLPSINDIVYVKHNISIGATIGNTISINHLFISGLLTVASGQNPFNVQDLTITGTLRIATSITCVLNVNGNLNVSQTGLIDFASATVNVVLTLNGLNNFCPKNNYLAGSTILTYGIYTNKILDLNYYSLTIGAGTVYNTTKYLETDLVVNGNFVVAGSRTPYAVLELQSFNLTVNGISTFNGIMSKNEGGNILFIGNVSRTPWIFNGNPTIEFRGGATLSFYTSQFSLSTLGTWGTGIVNFTTNTQTINIPGGTEGNTGNLGYFFQNQFIVDNGITVNLTTTVGYFLLDGTINGNNSSSQFVNKGSLYFNNASASNAMTTGIFDTYTFANTIGYVYTGNGTIYQTSLSSLVVTNNGIKTVIGNTSLSGNLTIGSNPSVATPVVELSSFNLTVNGTSLLGNGAGSATSGTLKKSGSGTVIFGGLITLPNSNPLALDFSTGNPNVTVKAGISAVNMNASRFKTGTGIWTFSTNNQSIDDANGQSILVFSGPIVIDGISLSTYTRISSGNITFESSIDGTNGSSNFIVKCLIYLTNSSYYTPMPTFGTFDYLTFSTSIIGYFFNGSITLPATNYNGLSIRGTGTKTVSGNLNCTSLYVATANGYLELGNYDLINTGITSLSDPTLIAVYSLGILKSGAGNVRFDGLISIGNTITGAIDFSGGNPSVEIRAGISSTNNIVGTIVSGTGLWLFSTNNQSLYDNGGSNSIIAKLDCLINISSGITLSINYDGTPKTLELTGVIDGLSSLSKLLMIKGTFNYKNATEPMVTGLLDTSTNANTFIYGNGNQDIKGGTYRNLTLNGGGVKTLQGNVSVLNTYVLTAPATKNDNGFTFGNP